MMKIDDTKILVMNKKINHIKIEKQIKIRGLLHCNEKK